MHVKKKYFLHVHDRIKYAERMILLIQLSKNLVKYRCENNFVGPSK